MEGDYRQCCQSTINSSYFSEEVKSSHTTFSKSKNTQKENFKEVVPSQKVVVKVLLNL